MDPQGRAFRLPRPTGLGLDVALAASITLIAGVVRFVRLGTPDDIVPLDETYYAVNSFGQLEHGVDMQCSNGAPIAHPIDGIPCKAGGELQPAFAVHPPAGKWFIALGIRLFGYSPFGYRAGAALAGTLSVLLLYMIARRLWRSPWIAATAAALLAVDGLQFVQSRLAMLDIFLSFFILLAVWLLVEDRERTSAEYRGIRPWRVGAGAAIGLALATKWSAAFMIPMLFIVALVWDLERIARRRRARFAAEPAVLADASEYPEASTPAAVAAGRPEAESAFDTPGDEIAPEPPGDNVEPSAWNEEPGALAHAGEEPPASEPEIPSPLPRDPWATTPPSPARSGGGTAIRALWAMATFLLLPAVVYTLTYAPWFAADPAPKGSRYTAPRCGDPQFTGLPISPVNSTVWNWDIWPADWREWTCYQREIFDYHKNLKNFDDKGKPIHPYLTRAWSWPWIGRPTAHEFDSKPSGIKGNPNQAEILGLPNPGVWYAAFFLAIPLCAWWAIARRDQTAALLLLLFAPLYVPWLVTSRPLFLFYMTPAVPFLILLAVHVAHRALREWTLWAQQLLAAAMVMLPFMPLVIQWFSVPGFRFNVGTNAVVAIQRPLTMAGKAALVCVFAAAVWLAVSALYSGKRPGRLLASWVVMAALIFAYFYPAMAAVYIPDNGKGKTGISATIWQAYGWRSHMWLTADCRSGGIKIGCWI